MNVTRNGRPVVRYALGALVVCVLGGVLLFALNSRPQSEPETTGPTGADQELPAQDPRIRWQADEFVGSQKCGECHAEIAQTYAEHPMARTLATVRDAAPLESIEGDAAVFESHGRSYRVERDGDRLLHTEFMTDDDGRPVYQQTEEVQYAVGSGTNARTYMIDRGGILFESPITWYTEKRIWDLSPGYHEDPGQRFNRRITDGCIQCHSGRPAPVGDGISSRFETPPFFEPGIGCERCHGPGKRHVDMFEAADRNGVADDVSETLIVNPGGLDGRPADSICNQCHMAGKRRILRKGKSYHDFLPGMATEDVWTVFVAPTPVDADGAAHFVSHVEQMRSSACFRGTGGRMGCTTCHDPHASPAPDKRAAFYRDRCNNCHAEHGCTVPLAEREPAPAFNSCLHCHMPSSGSSDIPHTSASDHRILRNPRSGADSVEPPRTQPVWTIFDDSDQRMPAWEVERARALALSEQALEESDQRLLLQALTALEAARLHDADDIDVLSALGSLDCMTRNDASAMATLQAALRIDPQNELSLKNLGMMSLQTRSFLTGLRACEAYVKVNEWDGTLFGPYAALLANSGDLEGAVEAAERGLRLDPTQLKLRSFAVQLYERLGDRQKSREHGEKLRVIGRRLEAGETAPR